MKEWEQYSQTRTSPSALKGSRPSVFEYGWIKFIDSIAENALTIFFCFLLILFASIGAVLSYNQIACGSWFLDAAKLCLGVLLGILSQRRRSK